MKQFLFFFLLITSVVNAQDFSGVDAQVKSYPRYTSPQKLVDQINHVKNQKRYSLKKCLE
ncbi:MAG: hypothetical protein ABF260_09895 [Flavobacteriaceae bacterium]|jgi:ribosomal protein L31